MSKTITVEITIDASLDEVWNEVSKIENHSNWMKDAVNIDFQSESKSGVGTKIKVLTKIGPIKLYDYMTFTKWEEKKIIGVDHVGIVTGKGEMEFDKIDEKAKLFSGTQQIICRRNHDEVFDHLKELYPDRIFDWSTTDSKAYFYYSLSKNKVSLQYQGVWYVFQFPFPFGTGICV